MKWSEMLQPAKYLKATRQSYLTAEFAPITAKYCGVNNNSKVLEVGCGTGYFSKYLSSCVSGVQFTAIDRDENLLANGEKVKEGNSIEFVKASAYSLPFEDSVFDAVYSFTFFNCVGYPELAMEEMKRVTKKGGKITSITSMSLGYEGFSRGNYPAGCEWEYELLQLQMEFLKVLKKLNLDPNEINKGLDTESMPPFFRKSGLTDVTIFPLSRAFSLSNATMPKAEKITYIENLYEGEAERLKGKMMHKDFINAFSEDKCQRYQRALEARREFWLNHLEDNDIWEWFGSSSLIVTGVNNK